MTFKSITKKYTTSIGKLRFIDKVDDFVQNYNNTVHSSTGLKPIDVYKKREIPTAGRSPKEDKLNVGDKVRTLIK